MDKQDLVRKQLLRRKINEYFSRNPQSSSAIFKMNAGDKKTVWKVVRENREFLVTEVHTKKNSFIMEAGTMALDPNDPRFKKGGSGTGGPTDPNNPGLNPIRSIPPPQSRQNISKFNRPTLARQADQQRRKDQATRMFGFDPNAPSAGSDKTAAASTPHSNVGVRSVDRGSTLPDKTSSGGQDPALGKALGQNPNLTKVMDWDPRNMNSKFTQSFRKGKSAADAAAEMPDNEFKRVFQNFGLTNKQQIYSPAGNEKLQKAMSFYRQHNPALGESVLREADEDDKRSKKPEKTKKKYKVKKSPEPEESEIETGKQDQVQDQGEDAPELQTGIETNPEPTDDGSEETPLDAMRPEAMVGQELSGKSLGSVSFAVNPGSTKLTMEVIGNANPSILEHRRDGTVVWQHRGQTKVFRPSGGISSDDNEKI